MTALACKRDPRNILGIPELFAMVAKFCDKSDLARLSSVCRATFYEATPLVWKRVEGIHNLLGLLPGIRVIKQRREHPVTLMVSSRVVRASELARLHLYLASIRDIKIYNTVVRHYDVTDWQILVGGLESQALPPNLQSLDFTSTCVDCAQYQPLWVQVFACNSLTAVFSILLSIGTNPEIPTLSLNGSMDLLSRRSPGIERLSLFPGFGSFCGQGSARKALVSLARTEPHFQSSLTTLSKLRDLDCSSSALYRLLPSIGSLLRLRSLTVWPDRSGFLSYKQDGLSSTSFPMLAQLTLHSTVRSEIESLLKMTLALRQVIALRISMDSRIWIPEDSWEANNVFPQLRNAPLLQELYIRFRLDSETVCRLCTVGYRILMDATQVLPLRTIALNCIHFQNTVSDDSPFRGIGAIWSQVTYLSMPEQRVYNEDLVHISTLSNLQYLLLNVLFSNDFPAENSLATSGGMMLHTLNGSPDSRIRNRELGQLARFLLRLWPNLLGVTWSVADDDMKDGLEKLNQEIRKFTLSL
ncbi:hypothetical protein FRC12_008146 [Ceratobasidium sp. 428]|nr:hypothetical protein FRC12_008146 [Ceratobasidium sp. 428]